MRPFHQGLRVRQASASPSPANPVARQSQIDALEAGKASVASVQLAAAVIQAGLAAIDTRLLPTEASVADFDDPSRMESVDNVLDSDVVVVYRGGVRVQTTMSALRDYIIG